MGAVTSLGDLADLTLDEARGERDRRRDRAKTAHAANVTPRAPKLDRNKTVSCGRTLDRQLLRDPAAGNLSLTQIRSGNACAITFIRSSAINRSPHSTTT
jgi:hypothetical protein